MIHRYSISSSLTERHCVFSHIVVELDAFSIVLAMDEGKGKANNHGKATLYRI